MYVPFDELSAESRVWIYQGSRPFTQKEEEWVTKALKGFCEQWAAHGEALKSSFRIERSQFVIMAVDEDFHNPSGCSIDSSVAILRHIHDATGVDLLNRNHVPFLLEDKITLIPVNEIKSSVLAGRIQGSTITFNTLASSRAEWGKNWEITVNNSWMAKYLPKTTLTA